MSHYNHLTIDEREAILEGRAQKLSLSEIGRRLNRNPSTISREFNRNTPGHHSYSPNMAQKRYHRRRLNCHRKYVLDDKEKLDYLAECVEMGWSPEQAVGDYERRHGHKPFCVPTVYRAIHAGRIHPQIKQALRSNWRRKANKGKPKDKRGCIPITFTIHDRPEVAKQRQRIGDWEADTIKSLRKGGLVTLVDRKSRLLLTAKVPDLSADSFNRAALNLFRQLPSACVKTLTVDNGPEFSGYKELESKCKEVVVFFADPYAAWQRASNENANGLLRQYFPKKTDFDDVSDLEVAAVTALINSRPRKIFGFRSALDVFLDSLHLT